LKLEDIPFDASPNFTPRALTAPKMIILHCPVGTMGSAINTFKNNQTKVSAHYIVGRDGSAVQMVHLTDVAWHAMHIPNYMSIGIEMQDIYTVGGQLTRGCLQDPAWFTGRELETTASIVAQLMIKFNIPIESVIGHNNYILKQYGNNHQDPGPFFPWLAFKDIVKLQLKLLNATVLDAIAKQNSAGLDHLMSLNLSQIQADAKPITLPVVALKPKRKRGRSIIPKRRK
jgi:N-acetyl-anhydromuramyl-L-alanine amidase AmpD